MKQAILVGLGGAAGTLARWALGGLILHHSAAWRFPISTFVVNVTGCLVAGVLAGLATRLEWFSPETRLVLFTGLLGGFTTFSAFGLETVYLLRRGENAVAASYVILSVVCGIGVLWLANLARATQLLNKTNQMNLTTRRLTEEELLKWWLDAGRRCSTVRVADRFSDVGLTGLFSVQV